MKQKMQIYNSNNKTLKFKKFNIRPFKIQIQLIMISNNKKN